MARQLVIAFLVASAFIMASTMVAATSVGSIHANHHKTNDNNANNKMPMHDIQSHYKSIANSISDRIKHIIIVMMENRSFDHMFGFYGKNKGVNGLTGKEYNLVDVSNPQSEKIYVDAKAPFINQCDPTHSYPGTIEKLYGTKERAAACDYSCVDMGGFVHQEHKHKSENYCNVMQSFNSSRHISVLTKLADEFALMDRFFCSIPGPTWPNRLFHLSATSMGCTETSHYYEDVEKKLYPQKTIFDQVKGVGAEWKLYYNDTPWEVFMESVAHNPEHLHPMTEFYENCKTGKLPDFAFINPLHGSDANLGGNNDQHPDHDIRLGEAYYKDIYEALRASPAWNETLFIITYDEHGGFHDHVRPPTKGVPSPLEPGVESYPDKGFKFDRIGVRIPTLLISPWVPKGLVISEAPAAQKPSSDSEYDLTSIMASARKILKKLEGVPPLTKRDAWASTFEHVFSMLDKPRTDCPKHLPTPGKPMLSEIEAEGRLPINDLQADILSMHHFLAEPDTTERYPAYIKTQSQLGPYTKAAFKKHRTRTLQWKASKGRLAIDALKAEDAKLLSSSSSSFTAPTPLKMVDKKKAVASSANVPPAPSSASSPLQSTWVVAADATTAHVIIHNEKGICFDAVATTTATSSAASVGDAAPLEAGITVMANRCYPSANPRRNRDEQQWWVVVDGKTIRPHTARHLCLAQKQKQKQQNQAADASNADADVALVLAKCDDDGAESLSAQIFMIDAESKELKSADGSAVCAF